MATLNKNYNKLQGAIYFREITKRVNDFVKKNPNSEIMRLGIGDTNNIN